MHRFQAAAGGEADWQEVDFDRILRHCRIQSEACRGAAGYLSGQLLRPVSMYRLEQQ